MGKIRAKETNRGMKSVHYALGKLRLHQIIQKTLKV